MHEDGIGMARTFEAEFNGTAAEVTGVQRGFFAAVDAAAEPGRVHRPAFTLLHHRNGGRHESRAIDSVPDTRSISLRPRRSAPVGVLTGTRSARR